MTKRKNPLAVALGKLAKGKSKTMSPEALAARRKGYEAGLKKRNEERKAQASNVIEMKKTLDNHT